jgi:phage FluMu protein Com
MPPRLNLEESKVRHALGEIEACAAKVDNSGVTLGSVKQALFGPPLVGEEREIDIRCGCGSLMAKVTPSGIEIKCRKCKRIQIIPYFQSLEETGTRGKNVKD